MSVDEINAELVLDAAAQVGEGPLWDQDTGTLVWVDILGQRVHRYDPATGADGALDVGQAVGAAVLRRDAPGLLLAVRDGFAMLDEPSGQLDLIVPVEANVPTNRMNDGKVDPAGRFWAGTMAFFESRGVGALYRLDTDLQVHQMLTGVSISNGLDWTADNRRMYYIDTPTLGVDVFDYEIATGSISNRQRLITVPNGQGAPDGMTLDAEGGLWVAQHGSGSVRHYTPDGELQLIVRIPANMATSCAFGGPDLRDLYITSMRFGMSDAAIRAEPLAGALFRCRPGVAGRPAYRFAG